MAGGGGEWGGYTGVDAGGEGSGMVMVMEVELFRCGGGGGHKS